MTMDRVLAVRTISLYAPTAVLVLAWALRPPRRTRATAALLATAWNVPALLVVNVVAQRAGWWEFAPVAGSLRGMPLDLLLGWAVLWGALPVMLAPRAALAAVVAVLAMLDVVAMPMAQPVVRLGDRWLVGEAMAIAASLVPAQLFARWTWRGRHTPLRAGMQAATFSAFLLWILPEVIFQISGAGGWASLSRRWQAFAGVPLQLALVPVVMGISAVQEFATRGGGTPIPFDPPRRLVTSGPYAYVANPMQLGMALAVTAWAALIGSWWLALAGPIALAYSIGLAEWDETADLARRFGAPWRVYRREVAAWIPRWRPYHPSAARDADGPAAARLYVAQGCGRCSEVAAWFAERHPVALEIVPAESHPERDLERITYDPCDGGPEDDGVGAVARALEHVHLGWALLGWTIRLPGLRQALQLVVDASGGEPQTIARWREHEAPAAAVPAESCSR